MMKMRALIVLSGLLTSTALLANTEMRENYKCYVLTTRGEFITQYAWYPSKVAVYQVGLPATKLPPLPMYGPLPVYIKSVVECVKQVDSFNTPEGRALDMVQLNMG